MTEELRGLTWKRTGSPKSHSWPCSQYMIGAGTPTSSSATCTADSDCLRHCLLPCRWMHSQLALKAAAQLPTLQLQSAALQTFMSSLPTPS